MAELDIVQRITQQINSHQRSKVCTTGDRTVVAAAARVGDGINHTSFWSALAGAVAGMLVTAGVFALASAAVAAAGITGGLAAPLMAAAVGTLATFALSGGIEAIVSQVTSIADDIIGGEPSGTLIKGSLNIFVNGRPLAIVDLAESVGCTRHSPPPKIAQGSETVSANGQPAARKGDKTECSATIAKGSPDVFIGSGQATYVEMQSEFTGFQRALLFAVEFVVPPTALFGKGLNKGLGKIRLGLNGADDVLKGMKKSRVSNAVSRAVRKAEIKPNPPFALSPKHRTPELKKEFERQLKDQQDAINNMKVKDWLKNREAFKKRDKVAYDKKAKEARDEYRNQEISKKINENIRKGMSEEQAKIKAIESLKGQSVLHSPDSIAGGKYNSISGFGNSRINSSIGSQWKNRIEGIEQKVKQQYDIPPKSIDDLPENAMMNIKLL